MSRRTAAVAVAVRAIVGGFPIALTKLPEPSVIGPKIVPPFADAMGFVDRQQPHADPAHRLDESRTAKSLGHDVNQPILARRDLFEPLIVARAKACC